MNGKMPYSRDTFCKADSERDFRGMLYDMLAYDASCTQDRHDECTQRFDKLERRKWWDKGLAMITAAIIALAAVFGLAPRG